MRNGKGPGIHIRGSLRNDVGAAVRHVQRLRLPRTPTALTRTFQLKQALDFCIARVQSVQLQEICVKSFASLCVQTIWTQN